MKLSKIVAYLDLLNSLQVQDEAAEATRRLAAVLHVVTNHELQVNSCTQDLQQAFDSVNQSLDNFEQILAQISQRLTQLLHEQEPAYLAESFRLFDQEMRHDSVQHILSRRISTDDQSRLALEHRLKNLTDWRYPGMIIGPRTEKFIEDMVPLDPLYLVDTHQNLINAAVHSFTPDYQRRLRQYVVNDLVPGAILNELPGNQFGVIFAYNYFNYRPMEVIQRYIQEIASKLRPGGSFIMTYNNCDRAHGIGLAEKSWMCYTPGRLIQEAANAAGLELVSNTDAPGDLSWIEFARPGELQTLRGGQSLAKIIAIPQ
jgi:SAM-dependent methyltransferase/ribosome-associated translation inhibitor RaiA